MTGVNLKCDDGGGQGNSRAESLGGINGINTHTYIYTHNAHTPAGKLCKQTHTERMQPHMHIHFFFCLTQTHTHTHSAPLRSLTVCFCQTPV